jgi:hypothetical protein
MSRGTRILVLVACLAALAGGVVGLTAAGQPTVTRARLEPAVAETFANLYVHQADIVGTPGVTTASVNASAQCDRGGPNVPDVGSGPDWVCVITFTDNTGQQQQGKFELQVRPDDTYVANGPSKLIGSYTVTDQRTGKEVPNPLFQFDGAFDPGH